MTTTDTSATDETIADASTATNLEREYEALKESCGLVDRSERGKLALSGSGAVEFLNGQVTNELADLHPGEGRYAAFLTHKGKMLGDLRILAVGPDSEGPPEELLLDTERGALQALFDMIRRFQIGYDVALHKRTLERGLLSLIGPRALDVAVADWLPAGEGLVPGGELWAGESLTPSEGLSADEHANAAVEVAGIEALAVRTPVGVDLICDSPQTQALAGALRERGAMQVSQNAAEIVRVERGEPRYGIDLDETTIPQEADLNERAVSFTKGCYVGQETVARLFYKGKPNRHLRGLRLSEPISPGGPLRLGERIVGELTSSVLSPALGPIGLALVRREAPPGARVSVGEGGATAEVLELPFAKEEAR
jgi:tRNA-modifying protein YgfZ